MAIGVSKGDETGFRLSRTRLFRRGPVRPAEPRDAAAVAEMANALALRAAGRPGRMTAEAVRRDILGNSGLGCLIADRQGAAAGYALFWGAYETAFASRGLYLSDLYIRPEHRRQGLGRIFMRSLARICEAEGGRFIWWATAPENGEARRFYDALGASTDPVLARAVFEAPFRALLES